MNSKLVLLSILLNACFLTLAYGQKSLTANTASETEINTLVKQIAGKNADTRGEALDKLTAIGQPAVPSLVKQLADSKKTTVLWTAQTILSIAPDNDDALGALSKTLKSGSGETERAAAFAMASSPKGIKLLADLLSDKNTFIRRSVVFAYDDLTETDLTGQQLEALNYAEPLLQKATKDKDQTVSEMAEEVLGQLENRRKEKSK